MPHHVPSVVRDNSDGAWAQGAAQSVADLQKFTPASVTKFKNYGCCGMCHKSCTPSGFGLFSIGGTCAPQCVQLRRLAIMVCTKQRPHDILYTTLFMNY